jgi:hypothetical protein
MSTLLWTKQQEGHTMTKNKAKIIGENIGLAFMSLGFAMLIIPFFKLLAYVAVIYSGGAV